jgi:ribosomal protein S24E
LKSINKDIRSWKRHYVVVDKYTNDDGDVELTVRCKTYAEEDIMKKKDKEYYQRMKRRARNTAIYWQEKFSEKSMSYEELAKAQSHFEKLGKRYGLLAEFRERNLLRED